MSDLHAATPPTLYLWAHRMFSHLAPQGALMHHPHSGSTN